MKLYTDEDIAKVREALQFVITACKIQGDKLGQLRWHTMSDSLTEALGLLDAGKSVEVVGWKWRCKPYCEYPKWAAVLGKRPADYGVTPNYEDAPLYAVKEDV